jgi:ribonuclease HII
MGRRPPPLEQDPWAGKDPSCCAGVDEVGRGALFGPVFAAAVVLPRDALAPLAAAGLTDSKKLSPRRRAALVPRIRAHALAWAIGQASAAEIDRHGIRPATERAMRRALTRLGRAQQAGVWEPAMPELVLVDGSLPLRGWSGAQSTLVAGDSRCAAIAAASVLAKEERDALVRRLALRFPGYGLERHAGYGTLQHRSALERLGPTPLHRLSFLGGFRTSSRSRPPAGSPPAS